MVTSINKTSTQSVTATGAKFAQNRLYILLSDGREVSLPLHELPWLAWLAQATPAQQANWSLEPGGYALYWEELDDGIEVAHILGVEPLTFP
jgi:hypothetical protein